MNAVLIASLAVAGLYAALWLLFGRHAEPWRPSGPDPETLDTPEAIARLQVLALEAHLAGKPDEVVRLMGWLFAELPPAELRALVETLSQEWLAVAGPRMSQQVEAAVAADLRATAEAAVARDFGAGRARMQVVLGVLRDRGFVHPGAALVAAGMNGAWARERFGATGGAIGRPGSTKGNGDRMQAPFLRERD